MADAGGYGGSDIYRERRVVEGPATDVERVETVEQVGYPSGYLLARRIVYYLLGIVEFLLLFRFALRLFGANPASPFAALIYAVTQVFVYPFTGLFPDITAGNSVFEPRTLVAMAVYAVVAWGIDRLLRLVMTPTQRVA